jgi:hypothetical protein
VTPAEITGLINSLATLVGATGATPLVVLILGVCLAPWLVLILISISQHRRFEAVVTMYDNNFRQVEVTQDLAKDFKKMAENNRDLVIYNTTETSTMKQLVMNNMYCPIVRKNANPKDINA